MKLSILKKKKKKKEKNRFDVQIYEQWIMVRESSQLYTKM